jgi:hypothetical protein
MPLPADSAEVVTRWWNAVTDDESFSGYLWSFPDAWDGAIRFFKSSS